MQKAPVPTEKRLTTESKLVCENMEKLGNISLVQISQLEFPELPSQVQVPKLPREQPKAEALIPVGFPE